MNTKIACDKCALNHLCIPQGMSRHDLSRLDAIMIRHDTIKRGMDWMHSGEKFSSIFAVRSGCLKTYVNSASGEEHIYGFHLPGEIIGLGSINQAHYTYSIKAVQTSSLCEIPFNKLEIVAIQHPTLYQQLLRIMSKELDNEQKLFGALCRTTAEQRVAAFLLNISGRFAKRGYSAHAFSLGMPRADIGNYLGLAVETVCRVFTRLTKEQIVEANGKHILIKDTQRLYQLADLCS